MKKIMATGVKFKRAGKIYEFLTNGVDSKIGDKVIIEAEKGVDIATVAVESRQISVDDSQDMKSVIRLASARDIENDEKNKIDCVEALIVCRELAEKNDLQMKLLMSEYSLDRSKITFYYTADSRVDFRQLVRDLARIYRTRVEMRQIGVRDATKIMGGFGMCGRELCCASFLKKFDNISIKTAKGQNLAMNPSKISGVCGRLMCCLVYEKDGIKLGIDDAEFGEVAEIVVEKETEGEL